MATLKELLNQGTEDLETLKREVTLKQDPMWMCATKLDEYLKALAEDRAIKGHSYDEIRDELYFTKYAWRETARELKMGRITKP
jgi:hypothetical protein